MIKYNGINHVEGIDIRKNPRMADEQPSRVTREGAEPQPDKWPSVTDPLPREKRIVYPGAGSELFHGIKGSD